MSQQNSVKPGFRKSVTFQAILLGGSTLIATVMLSTGNMGTREDIKLRTEEDLKASISQVVAKDIYDNDLLKSTITLAGPDGEPLTIYQVTKDGAITALAYTVTEYGYSGKITAIMALNPKGDILGVRILSHSETPGLGDKIEVAKHNWIVNFNGLSLRSPPDDDWLVKKDGGYFDQFSGATITPRAVVKSIKTGLEFFDGQKTLLLTLQERDSAESSTNEVQAQ